MAPLSPPCTLIRPFARALSDAELESTHCDTAREQAEPDSLPHLRELLHRMADVRLLSVGSNAAMTSFLMMDGDADRGSVHFTLPTGVVTFLLTDIEGSSRAWQADADLMAPAVARHYEIIDEVVVRWGGVRPIEQGEGDSIVAAFSRATDAAAAALDAQRQLLEELGDRFRVRMALHTGEAQLRDEGNYFGHAVIRCARLRSCGHGGQVLLSHTTRHARDRSASAGTAMTTLTVQRPRASGVQDDPTL